MPHPHTYPVGNANQSEIDDEAHKLLIWRRCGCLSARTEGTPLICTYCIVTETPASRCPKHNLRTYLARLIVQIQVISRPPSKTVVVNYRPCLSEAAHSSSLTIARSRCTNPAPHCKLTLKKSSIGSRMHDGSQQILVGKPRCGRAISLIETYDHSVVVVQEQDVTQ